MRLAVILVPASLALATAAHADVVISTAATANMACSRGVCAPTAKNAVLNVGDLETLLASGAVKVTTRGSGIQAGDIQIDAPFTWSSTGALVLDAYQSVLVERLISVAGQGGLSIATNDGGQNGYFGFQGKGQVTFANLSSALTINGASYALVGDIATLATDIATNPTGNYALADDYDAGKDGSYSNSAIATEFGGVFEGLGNTISDLSLNGTGDVNDPIGLFAELALNNEPGGTVENIQLEKLNISGNGLAVGGLVGVNEGLISNAFVSGAIEVGLPQGSPSVGELVGYNLGTVARSAAQGSVASSQSSALGGLVGGSGAGLISQSFANCEISSGSASLIGGLVGSNVGSIKDSYAAGSIIGGDYSELGGLVGDNAEESTIAQSYSTTALDNVGHGDRTAGGLIGVDHSHKGSNSSDYWDVSTSNITGANQGAGTPNKDRGIEPLTSEELQSKLPKGFDKKVWALNPKINGGFPYLIANPPRKD
jgi:hypothetical protein